MMLEEGLVTYLSSNAELTGLIGERLYPQALPQSPVMPAVVYQEIDSVPEYTQDGDCGMEQTRMQLKVWANTLLMAKRITAVLKSALSGMRSEMGGQEVISFVDGSSSAQDPETGLSYVLFDVMMWHQE